MKPAEKLITAPPTNTTPSVMPNAKRRYIIAFFIFPFSFLGAKVRIKNE
jgi:hypothetical protein